MKLSSFNSKNLISSLKFALVVIPAKIVRMFCKDIWIVTERPNQARDNGYCFFKYLRTEHFDKKVYYIIDKKSNDFEKVKDFGNIIQFDSIKHYFFYCLSKVHISAHIGGCVPSNAPIAKRLKSFLGVKDVFIPHGVSYGVSEFCLKKYAKIDLFVCSGKPEYENVIENYGYDKSEVAYTGFPRLDGWHNISVNKNQIVLMPTWRLWLAQNPNTDFKTTNYYKNYNKLINDLSLQQFLSQNNLKLVFYLHNDMRKYVDDFKTNCQNIDVVYNDSQYDIQELLKESALLITDYSSVHFDFAYMGKPVVYFQFDKEEFFDKQYKQSEFDAEKNGFGPVAYSVNELKNCIQASYNKNFEMDKQYYEKMRAFYVLHDEKNCERVFKEIINHFGK